MARMSSSSDSGGSSPRGRARTYLCKTCGNEFNSGQSLGGHMNVHRKGQRSQQEYSSPGVESSGEQDSGSMYKGVRYRKEQNKWVAEIRPPKSTKTWWLGTYSTPVEAAYAYDVAIKYFGSETSLNFDGHPVYSDIPRISPTLPKQDYAMRLRKVVKEYGKRAMASDDQTGLGSSTMSQENDHSPVFQPYLEPYDQPYQPYEQSPRHQVYDHGYNQGYNQGYDQGEEEYNVRVESPEQQEFALEDLEALPMDIQGESFTNYDTPFDFDRHEPPPVSFGNYAEPGGPYGFVNQVSTDHEALYSSDYGASGWNYGSNVQPALQATFFGSDYERSSEYYDHGYQPPQRQFSSWSPCSQYSKIN